jgi:hypothetical protein
MADMDVDMDIDMDIDLGVDVEDEPLDQYEVGNV